MGTYTSMEIKLPLEITARDIVSVLEVIQTDGVPSRLPGHSLFKTSRWEWVCGTNGTSGAYERNGIISYDESGYPWLDRKCSLKNYESCIERFLDWVAPAVALRERCIVGEYQVEYDDEPSAIEWDPAERRFLIGGWHRGPASWGDIEVNGQVVDGQATVISGMLEAP